MQKILFLILIITATLISCSENNSNDTYLTVEPDTLLFASTGGTATFNIRSNTDWIITPPINDIQVSLSTGVGNKMVQVSVPERKNVEQVEYRLMIKSADGTVVRNIILIQKGYLSSGGILRISNHSGSIAFEGKAQALDSLIIVSNAHWELRGPEWIEAYYLDRWITLSPSRAMVSGEATVSGTNSGHTIIYIRTANKNENEQDRKALLILSQPYSGDLKYELQSLQLGKHRVAPSFLITLATEVATNWKYGIDVKTFYWHVTRETLSEPLTIDKIYNWPSVSTDSMLISCWGGLDENTHYNIYTWTQDNFGNYYWDSYSFNTKSAKNQAKASIENVYHDGKYWRCQVRPNEYCKLYTIWAQGKSYFDAPDAYIVWMLAYYGFLTYKLEDGKEFNEHMWQTNEPIQIITYGAGNDGITLAGVIERYRSIDHYFARECNNIEANSKSMKNDIDAFKKSLIRIK